MKYRPFGSTGIVVSELSLGVMNFGAWANQHSGDHEEILARAIEAGVNLIDTADVYSAGESERILGALLAKRSDRDELIIATKFHSQWLGGRNTRGNSRHWVTRAVDASLQRLGLDHIDLYQIHRPEPGTAIDETLGALSDLVRAGKIRYFGTSTFSGHELTEARWTAHDRRHIYPVSEQLPYSILAREAEREVFEVARKYRLGTIVWSPLAGGWLGGRRDGGASTRLQRQPERHASDVPENRIKQEIVAELGRIAQDAGCTLPQFALAFVLANNVVSTVLLGPRTPAQLDELLAAVDLELPAETLARVDELALPGRTINPADTGYGRDHVQSLVSQQRRG